MRGEARLDHTQTSLTSHEYLRLSSIHLRPRLCLEAPLGLTVGALLVGAIDVRAA